MDEKVPIIKEEIRTKSGPVMDKMVENYDKVGMWCNMGSHLKSSEYYEPYDVKYWKRNDLMDKLVADHDKVGMWCNMGGHF